MTIGDEWNELCERLEQADNAHQAALSVMTSKLSAIGSGVGRENPTDDECEAAELAWRDVLAVREEMSEFVKKHVGAS